MADLDTVVFHPLPAIEVEYYESIFECHPDAIYVIGLHGQIVFANAAARSLFGYSREELLVMAYPHLFEEADRERIEDLFEGIQQGTAQEFEVSVLHRAGHGILTQVTHIPILMAGRLVASYLHIKDNAAYKQYENRLRIIEENVSDLITITDARTQRAEYISPSHETVLGFTRDELVDSSYRDMYHPDDIAWVDKICRKMLTEQVPISGEYRRLHADGHWVLVEGKAFPVRDENGEVGKIVVVARDISERKQTEELLIQSEKLSIAGRLAAGIAHEIRNPLTAIKGFLQIMKQNKLENGTYLNLMLDEMDSIEVILSELLVLAKPQATPFVSQYLSAIWQDVLTLINSEALMHNIQIELEFGCELPKVTCDPNQLKQMFLNFLKNSIDAMEHGGTIKIKINRGEDRKHVIVQIIDEGCGMSEEVVSRLGEPFYVTKAKGTGLGMMVCKRILESHSGKMRVQSQVNVGTTIEVSLPLEK